MAMTGLVALARGRAFVRRTLVVSVGAFVLLPLGAGQASAHTTVPSDAQHYRSVVAGVAPAGAPFAVRVGRIGDWIELRATEGQPLTVLGYFGEPYLRVSGATVELNTLSPTEEMNGGLLGTFGPAELDNARRAPHWVVQGPGPTARWRDLRTQWVGAARPAEVGADPRHAHAVDNWRITVQGARGSYVINGTLSWTPIRSRISPALVAFLAVDTVALVAGAVLLRRRFTARRPRALPPIEVAGATDHRSVAPVS